MDASTRQRTGRFVVIMGLVIPSIVLAAGGLDAALPSVAFWAAVVPTTLWWAAENVVLKQDEPRAYRGKLQVRLSMTLMSLGAVVAAVDHYRLVLGPLPQEAWVSLLGGAVCLAGAGFRIAAIRTLDRHFRYELRVESGQRLVESGVYRRVRHPSYLGLVLIATGISLAFASLLGLVVGAVGTFALLALRIRDEERVLREAFGPAYDEYSRRSWRLIPPVY
jgi:protein-S-isoprenylcysteine O-methyltransferase Ste14